MAIRTICAVVFVMLSTTAPARQPDAFDACARNSDPSTRLACFDREVAARNAADELPKSTVATPATPRPAAAAASDIGLDARELRRQRAQRGEPEPAAPAPIEAVIVRVIQRQPLISAFELDNGQIWEQSEAMRVMAAPHQKVVISHGALGSFFLKTANGTVVVRVHRVK